MKTGWHNKSRKDKLADLASRCRAVTEKANAWDKLTQSIETLAEPEVPYTPKFRDMLLAILRATLGAVVEPGFPEQSVSRRFMCRRCYEVFDIDVPQARPKGYSVTCPKCGALTSNALEST